jgi:hypothetical protein
MFQPKQSCCGQCANGVEMSLIFLLDGRKPDQAGLAVGGSYVCEEVVLVKRHERACCQGMMCLPNITPTVQVVGKVH